MSKITFDRIVPLLTQQEHLDGVLGLLRDIIVLQAKLDNLDKQDFYFQKGKINHLEHLESMKKQYSQIVKTVNGNSVDYFLEQVNEYESKAHKLTSKGYLNMIDRIALNTVNNEVSKYMNLIQIKGKFGTLKPLDELMQDENTLLEIFK